jgi:type IV secretion system protein VirD4
MDELSVMDGSKCVLQLRGVRPFLSDKFDITKHKNYRYLSDADPKNAFDIGKFVSTRLKVNPDEQYTVVEYVPDAEDMPDAAFGDFQPPNDDANEPDPVEYEEDLEPI